MIVCINNKYIIKYIYLYMWNVMYIIEFVSISIDVNFISPLIIDFNLMLEISNYFIVKKLTMLKIS